VVCVVVVESLWSGCGLLHIVGLHSLLLHSLLKWLLVVGVAGVLWCMWFCCCHCWLVINAGAERGFVVVRRALFFV
jgi:hypothetical protein